MRIATHSKVPITLTLSILAAVMMAGLKPVAAQENHGLVKELDSTVRLGGYLPSNHTIKTAVGDVILCGGIDHVIQHNSSVQSSIVSVDYIDKSNGNYGLRVIPVTFGQITTQQTEDLSKSKIYFGYGVGVYFTKQNIPNAIGELESKNSILYGGYLNVGFRVNQVFVIDARYHAMTTNGSANAGGLELTAGVNF